MNGQTKEFLLQALWHERGGVLIYKTAIDCAVNRTLGKEWKTYLAQTEKHVGVLTDICLEFGLDPNEVTPGCKIVQHNGRALLTAMQMALAEGDPKAAEVTACEAVVLAETKDHANWELLGKLADALEPGKAEALKAAYREVEDQEDEHLYHTKGWCRELHLKALGLKAQLPPPEEKADVKTAIEAAKAAKGAKSRSKKRSGR